MNGPVFGKREALSLEHLAANAGGGGWESTLLKLMDPARPADMVATDKVARYLAQMVHYEEGRAVIEWLMDLTLRQPMLTTVNSVEQVALQAARRTGIEMVGNTVLKAIAQGDALLKEKKG